MSTLLLDAKAYAERLRQSPYAFANLLLAEAHGIRLRDEPALNVLAHVVKALTHRQGLREIINAPPAYASAMTVGVLIAYRLGHRPKSVIEVITAGADPMDDHFGQTHDLLAADSFGLIFRTRLGAASRATHTLRTTLGGQVTFRTLRQAQAGPPVDLMIFERPQADGDMSKAARDVDFALYQHACRRLKPHGSTLLVTHRMHEDDISGRLIAGGEHGVWFMPLIAEQRLEYRLSGSRGIKRVPGDVLGAATWSPEQIGRLKRVLSPEAFAAQYQQAPLPADDGPE